MKQQITIKQLEQLNIMQQREFFIRLKTSTNYREEGNYFEPPNIGQMIEYLPKHLTLRAVLFWIMGKGLCDTLWKYTVKLINHGA